MEKKERLEKSMWYAIMALLKAPLGIQIFYDPLIISYLVFTIDYC